MTTPSMPLPQNIPVLASPAAIDYTTKDYQSFVQMMLAYAAQVFPEWTPSSEGDFGVALVELFAAALDIQSYYADRISQEAYLPTATQRLSLLNIARMLGYIPSNGSPATGTVTFQSSASNPTLTIPAGTQVSTSFVTAINQPVIYETQQDATLPGAGGTVTVPVTQGITYSQVQLGTSNALPGQTYQITQTGVQDGTVQVFVQNEVGVEEWQYIQFLVDAGPEDKVFTTWVDQNLVTNVIFGDGVNGLVPGLGLNVYASYRVILGSYGNTSTGQVGNLVSSIQGVSIPLAGDGVHFQSSAMAGGADPETNEQIRANAPQAFQAQYRAVSLQDFVSLALQVPGVLMASATGNHSTSVTLYLVGPNYSTPTTALVNNTLDYFTGKTLAGVTLNVAAPALVLIDVGSTVNPCVIQCQPNYSQLQVNNNVITALQTFLSPPAQQFGQQITLSDIYETLLAVDGVDWCTVPIFTREDAVQTQPNPIQLRPSEIAQPGQFFLTLQGGF